MRRAVKLSVPPARPALCSFAHERAVQLARLRQRDLVGDQLEQPQRRGECTARALRVNRRWRGRDQLGDRLKDRPALLAAARAAAGEELLHALGVHRFERLRP